MKKNLVVIAVVIVCLLIIIPASIGLYYVIKVKPFYEISEDPKVLSSFTPHYSYDDVHVSSYITQNYYPSKETKEILKKIEPLLPKQKEIFNPESLQKVKPYLEEIVPNNFKKFVSSFIQYIIKDYIEEKKDKQKEIEEYKNNMGPLPITYETTKLTAIYWYLLAHYLETFDDHENSLLLSQGIFYLSRKWEKGYYYGLRAINKTHTLELCHLACNSILVWASKPKPQMAILSKKIAEDILDLVNIEFPLSMTVEYERNLFEELFEDNDFKHFCSKQCKFLNEELRNNQSYFNTLDEVYKIPLGFIDKPIYELKNEFKDYKNEIQLLLKKESKYNEIIKFLKNPVKALTIVLLRPNHVDFEIIKNHYEQKLAEMELTAIALVINAFSAENQRIPESISELSKWFGRELPKNRFTNQPYELDLKGKHILYNKGIDGIENLDSKETDDIYFDFSL